MWKGQYQCAVAFSVDVDCESLWHGMNLTTPNPLSRGEFGARAGVPRLLDLFERYEVPATWFVPAQTAVERTDLCTEIRRRAVRFELGYHGYYHESVLGLSIDDERDLMKRAMGVLSDVFQQVPRGNRSPWCDFGPNTADLLEELGFVYDSSLMGDDVPYRPRVPYTGQLRDFVELPLCWELGDGPFFMINLSPRMSGFCTPAHVFEIWSGEFDAAYRKGGYFELLVHPQIIGRQPRIDMLEMLIKHIGGHRGVWWTNHLELAEEWKRQQIEKGGWD